MNGGMDYVRILRDLREDADKTQTQIAEVLGTSQTMYARYERGANELPIHHLITLSKYYGVSTDYLLGLSKEGLNADRALSPAGFKRCFRGPRRESVLSPAGLLNGMS